MVGILEAKRRENTRGTVCTETGLRAVPRCPEVFQNLTIHRGGQYRVCYCEFYGENCWAKYFKKEVAESARTHSDHSSKEVQETY